MNLRTIDWKNNSIKIIDQTKLPLELKYLYIKDIKKLWKAIKELQVRGAPALGAAAGYGIYLGAKSIKSDDFSQFYKKLNEIAVYLASSRPTARNLFWGIERMLAVVLKNKGRPVTEIKKLLFKEANKIVEEDRSSCRNIGRYGAKLIKKGDTILTICNAGILATIDYGTALGVIYRAKSEGKHPKVYSCETRPLLQGARLTSWELSKNKIDVTLNCDNMAALLMRQGKINLVIAGADRIAQNGDSANKIGTYNLAILAKFHKIPFFIAAPSSTFDLSIGDGSGIVIEERKGEEITGLSYKKASLPGIKVYNPAFDVTPNELITAIISDKGIIRPPYRINIRKVLHAAK